MFTREILAVSFTKIMKTEYAYNPTSKAISTNSNSTCPEFPVLKKYCWKTVEFNLHFILIIV